MRLVSHSQKLFLPLSAVTESGGIASTRTTRLASARLVSLPRNILDEESAALRRGEARRGASQIVEIHKKSIGRIK